MAWKIGGILGAAPAVAWLVFTFVAPGCEASEPGSWARSECEWLAWVFRMLGAFVGLLGALVGAGIGALVGRAIEEIRARLSG